MRSSYSGEKLLWKRSIDTGHKRYFSLYSWRGSGYPLAILEAMASCCAVIAWTEPIANTYLLDEERGIACHLVILHRRAMLSSIC